MYINRTCKLKKKIKNLGFSLIKIHQFRVIVIHTVSLIFGPMSYNKFDSDQTLLVEFCLDV